MQTSLLRFSKRLRSEAWPVSRYALAAVQCCRFGASPPALNLLQDSEDGPAYSETESREPSSDYREQRFIDKVYIQARAGRGGSGGNSFGSPTRGKQRPPSGGNGGPGGNVVVQACSRVKSLAGLNHLHRGKNGGPGQGERTSGSAGADCVIKVPVGTIVYLQNSSASKGADIAEGEDPDWIKESNPFRFWNPEDWVSLDDESGDDDSDTGSLSEDAVPKIRRYISSEEALKRKLGDEIADLREDKQSVLLARGGQGGRGNAFLPRKRSRRKDEDTQRQGTPGERVAANLEMRFLCDIGLVGAPNAGKSSLLRALSAAAPKVASYPFTTLQPNLGSIRCQDDTYTVADIPGIIQGAAENRGLGHSFLRHISRASALAYVVDISIGVGCRKSPYAPRPWDYLDRLQAELWFYNRELPKKPAIVIANKIDRLLRPERTLHALRRRTDLPVIAVSALEGYGVEILKTKLRDLALSLRV